MLLAGPGNSGITQKCAVLIRGGLLSGNRVVHAVQVESCIYICQHFESHSNGEEF